MCDIILASKTAKFGQPEINLGVIPGGGGSQRLARAVGKSRAMEMVLTGRNVSAEEAAQWGMISRVVEGDVVQEALDMAKLIASKGQISVQAGKEVVNAGECRFYGYTSGGDSTMSSIRVNIGGGIEIRAEDVPWLVCHQGSEGRYVEGAVHLC